MKYRKKPVVIDAFQLNSRGLVGEDWFWDAVSKNEIITYYFGKFHPEDAYCDIKTLEGTMRANTGDYIIRGVNGEIYPCKADIFEKTYELVEIMERLTKTYSDGTHGASDNLPCGENSYDYKNLLIEKLGKYEDLEEQGRLIKLPCKIGTEIKGNGE